MDENAELESSLLDSGFELMDCHATAGAASCNDE